MNSYLDIIDKEYCVVGNMLYDLKICRESWFRHLNINDIYIYIC